MFLYFFLALVTTVITSEIKSQDSLAVTIYNNNFAMVKDVRNIHFDEGESILFFNDVSSRIETQTVTFKALHKPDSVRVSEQNFEKNLVDQSALLKKYINKEVEVIAKFGQDVRRISGTLLSYSGSYTIQTKKGVVILKEISSIDLASLPEGFFTVPTLNWKVFSKKDQTTLCEVAYRTKGFSWKADYSLTLNKDESLADVGGWVTIDNNSGKKYENTKVKLIAGDVNTVSSNIQPRAYFAQAIQMEQAPNEFSQKQFGDYHLYTLAQTVSINENSQKQVEFIPKVFGVKMRKFNQIQITTNGYTNENIKASSKVEFRNEQNNGLGIPIPKGIFRVFKEDQADNSLEFIGEDSVDHTPKNQNITLNIGNVFDITVKMYQQSKEIFKNNGYTSVMNLTITNHKETPSEIEVKMRSYYGDNLQLEWADENGAELQKVSGNMYKIVKLIEPSQTVVYKWTENYRP